MPYVPPSGWLEEIADDTADSESTGRFRFHLSDRCPRIATGAQLMAVDKPYSATRCSLCAKDS